MHYVKLIMIYAKNQKIKIVKWCFESKYHKIVRRCYAREFNVRYVEALQQKFIQCTVQKVMNKGTVLDCRKGKLVRQNHCNTRISCKCG